MDLTTRYMGLDLKSPLVSSASPVNADLDNIRRLEDAGIGAIVLPSLFEEEIEAGTSRQEDQANSQIARSGLNYFPDTSPFHALPEGYLNFVRRAAEAVEIPDLRQPEWHDRSRLGLLRARDGKGRGQRS